MVENKTMQNLRNAREYNVLFDVIPRHTLEPLVPLVSVQKVLKAIFFLCAYFIFSSCIQVS